MSENKLFVIVIVIEARFEVRGMARLSVSSAVDHCPLCDLLGLSLFQTKGLHAPSLTLLGFKPLHHEQHF